jgi:DNA-binding Lrp family transcriptional regulator
MLSELEKKVVARVQGDIPICERPYLELAEKIGIGEAQFLDILNDLSQRGVMRRFGATLRHQKSGFGANAMVAWKIDEARIDRVGPVMADFPEVSHCYRRNPQPQWPYNVYTMIHADSESACRQIARRIAASVQPETYKVLFSRRELKKTSMQYIDRARPSAR